MPQPLPQRSAIADGTDKAPFGGIYHETSVQLNIKQDKNLSADYRIWIPDNVPTIRGLLVKQHGCGAQAAATGLDHANDLQWQALAAMHQLALLGTKLPADYPACTNEAARDRVVERAFLYALTALAEKSRHPELDIVPWILWGHSGGADWSMQMLRQYPKRTIAVIALRSGGILLSDGSEFLNSKIDSTILNVPVLFMIGEQDPNIEEAFELPQKVFYRYRASGALWSLAIEANAGHEAADSRFLAIPYLNAILSMRLKEQSTKLMGIDLKEGWLSNMSTHIVSPFSQYEDNPFEASWLPDDKTAYRWQAYTDVGIGNRTKFMLCRSRRLLLRLGIKYSGRDCAEGKISFERKPPKPKNVRLIKSSSANLNVAWDFVPDLENGLPSFRVYRNSKLLRTLQGQTHNFGDAPVPANVFLEFQDRDAKVNSVYAVSAFSKFRESYLQLAEPR